MANDNVEVKVKLTVDEAQKKLKKFREDISDTRGEAQRLSRTSGRPGRGARLQRARRFRAGSGGGGLGGLGATAGKAAGAIAAIFIILELVKKIPVAIDALGKVIEKLISTKVGKTIQGIATSFNKFTGKILGQIARVRAFDEVASPFASAGIGGVGASNFKQISDAFVEESRRSFQESQRKDANKLVNYGKAGLNLLGSNGG